MTKFDQTLPPEINQLIINKLKSYPLAVAELAIKAIQFSENLPEATVLEALQGAVRDIARRTEAES